MKKSPIYYDKVASSDPYTEVASGSQSSSDPYTEVAASGSQASGDPCTDDSEFTVFSDSSDPEIRDYPGVEFVLSCSVETPLRRILTLALLGGNFASLNGGVLFFILGWFVRNTIQSQITFLADFYSPAAIPSALSAAACVVFVAGLLGLKSAVDVLLLHDPQTAATWLRAYWVAASVASLAILVAACVCFAEVRSLRQAMGQGLVAGMQSYVNHTKVEIDRLQMEYQCCGNSGYKDWYEVAWIDAKYLNLQDPHVKKHLSGGKYRGQDVPFSCCRAGLARPCADVRVEDVAYHAKYSFPQDATLHVDGCSEKITDAFARSLFRGIGAFVFCCFLLWISMTIIGRYLHTSMSRMALGYRPVGWLIPIRKKTKNENVQKESEDSD